jgi:FkbM family methyltransferase
VVRLEPYRWRLSGSFLAHLFKAALKQHHRALIPTLAQLIPPDAVVFDVGAHAGQYTKLFARAAARGQVYAFEPGSYARSILRAVVWVRGLANVTVLPMALGAASGITMMNLPIKRRSSLAFGLAHLGMPIERWPVIAQELVPLTTIDTVVKVLAPERLDFIKADIEGWELRLLHGAERALRRFRPRLLIELSDEHLARAGDRLADAFGFLAQLGYSAFERSSGGALVPVVSPGDGDFWFIAADDPVIGLLPSRGRRAPMFASAGHLSQNRPDAPSGRSNVS